ncbi:uroporphyrinogen-III C-methyltransferase [Oceanisphaera avium]|uniref:Heme biosynthesis operon protein HemX n=1 Tax=Oceanisphaera avium TaxID=1903694 RepID=A0A1Y0CYV6_9GAMM|nr:uroporphyrinogen-III C-methyltransferase [Oceanisphaera avium]ART80448.1 heme biosynthesis operon protein HemX [Oceanisphaera avium]
MTDNKDKQKRRHASADAQKPADVSKSPIIAADNKADSATANTVPPAPSAEIKTDSKNPDSNVESKPKQPAGPPPVPPHTPPPATPHNKGGKSGVILAIIAIIIAIVLAGVLYWHGHNQALAQAEQVKQLEQKIQGQQQQVDDALAEAESKQAKQLAKVASQQEGLNEQISGVSRKVLDLDTKRPNDWMLAEAEYLVRMAGRKLWLEQDGKSAAMMLANADERLAAVNDPSLTPIRRALADDIAAIKALPNVDRDGMAIKLNSVSEQVEKLTLDKVIMEEAQEPDFEISGSVKDWKENLQKSWHSFSENFVTVRRRDGKVEALLSPQQHWYLSENLKGTLLQAQLAVYRDQQEIFDSALAKAQEWLTTYYADDSVRQSMLEQIKQLSGKKITVDYPEKFSAQDKLKQLLDDRLQRLLTGQ